MRALDVCVGVEQAPGEYATPSIIERAEPTDLKRYERPLCPGTPNALDDRSSNRDDRLRHERPQSILQLGRHLNLRLHPAPLENLRYVERKQIDLRVNDNPYHKFDPAPSLDCRVGQTPVSCLRVMRSPLLPRPL
jgi:hypothetical protein